MSAPSQLTLVTTSSCHLCEDAHTALTSLGLQFPITVESVSIDSDRGQQLLGRHRPGMLPLVLLDGEWFSAGRLPRRKLEKALNARTQQVGV